jgi:enoyl-CoA hydratase/carnithine racemase
MQTGIFRGFGVRLEAPGIAWITFNTPERLNGMTSAIKRDLVETLVQAQMDTACASLSSPALAGPFAPAMI